MVLIGLLERNFLENLSEEKCPNHLIFVSKRDVLNIQEIYLPIFIRGIKLTYPSIDLSKLEKICKQISLFIKNKYKHFKYFIIFKPYGNSNKQN